MFNFFKNDKVILEIYHEELTASGFVGDRLKSSIKALSCFQRNKYEKALKILDKMVDTSCNSKDKAFAHFFKGVVYKEMRLFHPSEKEYKIAIELYDGYYKFHNCLGWVYQVMEDYTAAINEYNSALQLNSSSFLAYTNLSAVYLYLGQFDEAIEKGLKSIQLNPTRCEAYSSLTLAYAHIGDINKTREYYNHLVLRHYSSLDNLKKMVENILNEEI